MHGDHGSPIAGKRKVYGDNPLLRFGLAKLEDFRHNNICSESKVPGPYSVKVVHRYGPCSHAHDVPPPTVHEILSQDARRVAYLHDRVRRIINRARGNSSSADHALRASLKAGSVGVHRTSSSGQFYAATFGLGTPAREQSLVLDTGSDVCWVKCEPYAPHQPNIFDPRTSRSYHNVTCNAKACLRLNDSQRGGCLENTCVYRQSYVDDSSTTGFLATERLTLADSGVVLGNFVFGCSRSNKGDMEGTAGMLGLGRGLHSFASQVAADRHGGPGDDVFSYCLPSVKDRTGHLTFGRRAAVLSPPMYTPMVSDPRGVDHSSYFIEFLGISVGGTRLHTGPEHFATHGTILDSGTAISWLPPAVYEALRTAFRKRMAGYRRAPSYPSMDTCYKIPKRRPFRYPALALHFRDVDLFLKPEQVFSPVRGDSVYCLAFAVGAENEPSAIGNTQQRGMEVTHDNEMRRIGFSTTGVQC